MVLLLVTDVADIRSLSGSFDNNVPLTVTSCSGHRPVRARRRLSPAAHATIKKGITTSSGFACRRTFWLVMIPHDKISGLVRDNRSIPLDGCWEFMKPGPGWESSAPTVTQNLRHQWVDYFDV
jgi:hypothetical protein